MTKKLLSALLCFFILLPALIPVCYAEEALPFDLNCRSAVLMEAETGTILYEKNADEALPPASVTKIMTLLIIMEAIDSGALGWNDTVTASAHATSMGGSQIFLKEGEQMSVRDMVKSVVIASANDAAVALAEHICGSESAFVARMNARAAELGMKNTVFENTNGLDDSTQNHVTSARDIAIMSRELIRHKEILEFSATWMDTVRDGAFGLTNTNRLVRFYNGCTGLKTGSTAKAKFCISATAERDGMSLIAVIMASPTRDERNAAAKTLLDWGYANYSLFRPSIELPSSLPVVGGKNDSCKITVESVCAVVPKGSDKRIVSTVELPEKVFAPLDEGAEVGCIKFTLDGKEIARSGIKTAETVEKTDYFDVLCDILTYFLLKK